jgi:hypothetical protein
LNNPDVEYDIYNEGLGPREQSKVKNPGVEYIDSEVLAPEESNLKNPPVSGTQGSDSDDAIKIGVGIEAKSFTNTLAGGLQGKPMTHKRDPSVPDKLVKRPIIPSANTSWDHQEDPESLTGGTLLLEATKVESQHFELVTAVATKDNRKAKMLIIGACLVLIAIVVGLTVAFAGVSSDDPDEEIQVTQETFFDIIGRPIDGTVPDGNYGVSVATNHDGSRIAVADFFGVHVYELEDSDWVEMLGSNFQERDAANATSTTDSTSKSLIRAPVVATMSMDGNFVAVGWPLHNDDGNGLVEVYRYVEESLSWEREGNSLFGEATGDMFGASLSLSEDGSILAVGAAGNDGYAEVYVLDSHSWNQLGETVTALELQLDIFSVALSNDGMRFAVAGIPDAEDGAVARIFHLVAFTRWEERGSGVGGRMAIHGATIYLADLSGDGNTIVVSNYYTTVAIANTGEGLDVRAFIWSADTDDWESLGQNMHANYLAEKSGYFVSISENGRKIGMGDPGARVEGQGAVAGHAHFWEFKDEKWIQLGPNYEGEAAGDQFGYAVAISGNGDYLVASAPRNRALDGEDRGRVVVLTAAEPTVY